MREATFRDAARYLGAKTPEQRRELLPLLQQAEPIVLSAAKPRHILLRLPVKMQDGLFAFGGLEPIASRDLCRLFQGAEEGMGAAITLGADMDAVIRRNLLIKPGLGAAVGALASAYVDQLLDELMEKKQTELAKENLALSPRFSPGYGDVPLQWQKPFCALLGVEKAGIRLTEQCLMVPEKSITALAAVRTNDGENTSLEG